MRRDSHLIAEAYKIVREQQLTSFIASSSPRGDKIELNDDLLFTFGTSEFVPGGEQKLSEMAKKLKQLESQLSTKPVVSVIGHTDIYELKPGVNQRLSTQRAQKVMDVLKKNGVTLTINAQGVGASQPKVQLPSDAQYQRQGTAEPPEIGKKQQQPNRRVELKFNPPLGPIINQLAPPTTTPTISKNILAGPGYKMSPEDEKANREWMQRRGN